jgi:EmrB/QacA subfamily drug resistance transporter
MSKERINVITLGIMLSLFLASMEGTVVATAMPTIVGQLGGLSIYSWVFSIYLLTSTTTVPIYGKLSDLYGRKLVYSASMILFLAGSILCGQAQTMDQLIVFRGIQGLGAGGVLPLAFTIIGEIFDLEQRARMQGLFSGVWGVSSVIGPLIGGFLVDQVSWHWVFLINVIPGSLAVVLVWFAWQSSVPARTKKVSVDYAGAGLLTLAALSLLLGLDQLGTPLSWGLLAGFLLLSFLLLRVERRVPDPMLPLHLFSDRLFTVSLLHGIFAGWAMFGSLSYVPLFVQAVLGTSATQAGITLTPMSLAWTLASILGGRLLLKMGYRTLSLFGMVMLCAGTILMTLINPSTSQILIMVYLSLMGTGMGLAIPAFLIAVQSTVRKQDLGAATSTVQFSRSIGGTLGVSVLGAVLSSGLASRLLTAGIDPATISLDSLIDPVAAAGTAVISGPLRDALSGSIASLFITASAAAVLGLVVVFFAPGGKIAQLIENKLVSQRPEG